MSKLDIIGLSKLSFANEQPRDGFQIDTDVLREDPDVVLRKHFYKSINDLNTVSDYNNYGVVVYVIETTEPQLSINKIKKSVSGDDSITFIEYLIMPIDKSHASITTFLDTPQDILKSTTLIRCSSDIVNKKLAQGTFVKVQYDNNLRDSATIIQDYGTRSPVAADTAEVASPPSSKPFNGAECSSAAACASTADTVGYSDPNAPAVSSAASVPPEPQFSTPGCATAPKAQYNTGPVPSGYISRYFRLSELKNKKDHGEFTPEVIENLKFLTNECLDKLVDIYGRENINLNSVYRSLSYNKSIGGATKSQHLTGQAADIFIHNLNTRENVIARAIEIMENTDLPIDQFILESYGPNSLWYHISATPNGRCRNDRLNGKMMMGPWTGGKVVPFAANKIQTYISVNKNYWTSRLA